MIRKILSFILLLTAGLNVYAQTAATELDGDVKLMIGNDLGRNGYYEQKPIAALMGKVAEAVGPDAFLALGDTHHYLGINSVDDPLWMTNYDWSNPWVVPSRYYTRIFDNDGTRVKVVFIDTTPIIDKYHSSIGKYPDANKQDVEAQLRWLDNELSRDDNADWTVVAGHHPVYAQTPKQSSEREDMQKKVDPILKKHKVDMYICGHIHNFQHIRKDGIDYIVNTSGSLSRPDVTPTDGTVFCSGVPGFSVLTATKDGLKLSLIDNSGNVVHQVTRSK